MTQRPSAPTITDVARHAGVSMKTVSRVLNDEPNVQPQMRERVMASVKALNYRPNLHARSLARARSSLISLLYYPASAGFVAGMQLGATARCRELGYHLVVEALEGDSGTRQLEHMIATLRPDGVILSPPVCDDDRVLATLHAAAMRCVRISPGQAAEAVGQVSMDDESAAAEMTAYLASLGHRRIGFIEGDPLQAASPRRLAGYRAALAAHGLPADPSIIVPGQFTFRSGLQGGERLLSLPQPPTAIFAANDDMALGVVFAAQQRGLRVPADLSVAGFDDSPFASLMWPPLTTVRQPLADMAVAAVDMLVERAPPAAAVLPHHLLARGSTAAPRR